MARWRDTKKRNNKSAQKKVEDISLDLKGLCASPLFRFKAFVTDMFMIMMPIMYITTYIIMDGKESFQSSEIARWITMAVYGIITIIFWVKKGQTPGFKAYSIILIDDNTQKTLGFGLATARYLMFIFSAVSIIGFLLPFFRKDKKTLQDVFMHTSVVQVKYEENKK